MLRTIGATLALLLAIALPADAADKAIADMHNLEGGLVGTVTLTETPHGTLLYANLAGLPEGVHAFHIHAVGLCVAPFKSAGGHYNPTDKKHGILAKDGMHAGDMPNIYVPATGVLQAEILNTAVKLDDILFDSDGASIVIHQDADNYSSDPAGDAGPRIACGIIQR